MNSLEKIMMIIIYKLYPFFNITKTKADILFLLRSKIQQIHKTYFKIKNEFSRQVRINIFNLNEKNSFKIINELPREDLIKS